ncbi:DDE-type integrase/transposase/recombinase [Amycolatopsis sp. NPDC059657]|uniref:DDE-type integrase/transposase/recombinase n=1 Tax=Amycolatopsis sp. NPDC059657 TaxID=3346899 RepID=UPI003672ED27
MSRFAALAGIPERTYWRRLARHRAGGPSKGPWSAPKVDTVEATAAKYAADWPAWGHRKIAAMMRADGHTVSTSTVERALRRRGLLLPSGFRAGRRSWSRLRKRVFRAPPTERNRVWQMDFSEFETARGGIWRICAVIDYASKYCLAATVTPTSRGQDALACLRRAVVEAERVLDLDDLRADRGWMDVIDADADDFVIGEAPAPVAVVTDNGPCFRGTVFAEAFTGDGNALAVEINCFRHTYTTLRPHQALNDRTPRQVYLTSRRASSHPVRSSR